MMVADDRRVRVLHVITGLGVGGAEATLAAVAQGLARVRFEQRVVNLSGEGHYCAVLREHGIEVDSLGMTRGLPSWAAWRRFRLVLRAFRPQVLQTWLYHADFLGLVSTLAGERAPLLWNLRCAEMDFARYRPLTRVLVKLLARMSARPWAVVVNSEAGRQWHGALGYHPRRWEVIPNGFDTARFSPDPAARTRVRTALGIAPEAPLIGMVARVDPMKDHHTLFSALAGLGARDRTVHCVLIGAGTETLAPLARAHGLRDCVHLLGVRSDVEVWLPGLDLHVLSSRGEGFPNVVGEAMACAVPCVVSDVGDAATLIGDGGRVVPPQDSAALADAIEALLAGGELTSLGARARARIERHYSWGPVLQRYAQIYTEAAGMTD